MEYPSFLIVLVAVVRWSGWVGLGWVVPGGFPRWLAVELWALLGCGAGGGVLLVVRGEGLESFAGLLGLWAEHLAVFLQHGCLWFIGGLLGCSQLRPKDRP